MRGDDLPAELGETHPGLTLPADQVATTELEFQVHGREVATECEDFQPDPLLLDAGARRAGGPAKGSGSAHFEARQSP